MKKILKSVIGSILEFCRTVFLVIGLIFIGVSLLLEPKPQIDFEQLNKINNNI